MQYDNHAAVLRLKAVTEADPGALVRVLQFFQARNVVPRRVIARRLGVEFLEIEIELEAAQLPLDAFCIIVSKISELPIVMAAVACD